MAKFCLPKDCPDDVLLNVVKALLVYIPQGKVTSYKSIAKVLGISPRKVGKLLSANDELIAYPCHRVVRASGRVGGYMGSGSGRFKEKLLRFEGVRVEEGKVGKRDYVSVEEILELTRRKEF